MQGIELSRRFYAEIVRPWLTRAFPGLRHAAALTGYGSELLGFDDAMSRDHNWGPRVWLFLTQEDFAAQADAIPEQFARAAPERFLETPIGFFNGPHPPIDEAGRRGDIRHGLEVWTLEHFVSGVGFAPDEPLDSRAWLGVAEQWLLEIAAGAVFHDDDGRLTALRERLSRFPRDVRLYKLACQWRRIAEEQAFVGRTGYVGDDLGSRIVAARLVRDVMRMAFLIEDQYAPYPKWFGSAFARLPCAAALTPLLRHVLEAGDWRTRDAALAEAYLAVARLHQDRGLPGRFMPKVGPYYGRPFTVINAGEIMFAIAAEVEDPTLLDVPTIGSLDQVTDAAAMIDAPLRARAAMALLLHETEPRGLEEP